MKMLKNQDVNWNDIFLPLSSLTSDTVLDASSAFLLSVLSCLFLQLMTWPSPNAHSLFPYNLCCVCPLPSVDFCVSLYVLLDVCRAWDAQMRSYTAGRVLAVLSLVSLLVPVVSTACLYARLWSSHVPFCPSVYHNTLDVGYSQKFLIKCCTKPLLLSPPFTHSVNYCFYWRTYCSGITK